MEHYSAIKRDKSEPFAETPMDLEAVIESKSDREKQIPYTYMLKR